MLFGRFKTKPSAQGNQNSGKAKWLEKSTDGGFNRPPFVGYKPGSARPVDSFKKLAEFIHTN